MYKCCFWYDCTNVVTEYINVDTKYIVCTCTYVITEYKYVSLNIPYILALKVQMALLNIQILLLNIHEQMLLLNIQMLSMNIYTHTCMLLLNIQIYMYSQVLLFPGTQNSHNMTNTNTDTNIHVLLISKSIILKIQCVPDYVSSLVLNTIFCWFLCSFDAQKNGESSSIQEDWSPQVLMRPQY